MKRIFPLLLTLIFAAAVCCACGSSKTSAAQNTSAAATQTAAPKGISQDTFDKAGGALTVADDWLDGKTKDADAGQKLTGIKDDLNALSISDQTEKLNNELISISIESMAHDISQSSRADLLKDRNVLAQYLGAAQRSDS